MKKLTQLDISEKTLNAMAAFGGRFVKGLHSLYMVADEGNKEKLINAFEEIFRKYRILSGENVFLFDLQFANFSEDIFFGIDNAEKSEQLNDYISEIQMSFEDWKGIAKDIDESLCFWDMERKKEISEYFSHKMEMKNLMQGK